MNYIKGFHGIRAVSIGLVMLTHLDLYDRLPQNEFIKNRLWQLISGETGVTIFFVLSGFLITSLLLKEKKRTGTIHIKHFFARRFIRLLPPLIIFYVLVIALKISGLISVPIEGIMLAIFYCYNFAPNQFYAVELGHIWSLSLEEQYYLTWPFIVLFTHRFWRITAIVLLVILTCAITVYYFPNLELFANFRSYRFFIPAIAPIIIGSFIALLNETFPAKIQHFMQKKYLLFLLAIVIFCSPLFLPTAIFPWIKMIQSIGVGVFLIWLVYHPNAKSARLLEFSWLKYIGTISYGLYVFQGLFLRTGGGSQLWIQQFPMNVVLAFACAILSYELVEKRLLNWKKKFSN